MIRTSSVIVAGLLILGLVGVVTTADAQDKDDKVTCRIIYVPTPESVIDKMFDMAKIKQGDVVYDLGCGDGRILAMAAPKYKSSGVGVDIDPDRIKDSAETMKKYKVGDKTEVNPKGGFKVLNAKGDAVVEIRQGDALKVKDLDKATVIMLYMLPEFMEKLEAQISKLKPGTRIVAHDYEFPNWKWDQKVEFKGPTREHTLYMWTVKEKEKKKKSHPFSRDGGAERPASASRLNA